MELGCCFDRSPEVIQAQLQACLEVDLWFPIEESPCLGDVGLALRGVILRQRMEDNLAARGGGRTSTLLESSEARGAECVRVALSSNWRMQISRRMRHVGSPPQTNFEKLTHWLMGRTGCVAASLGLIGSGGYGLFACRVVPQTLVS